MDDKGALSGRRILVVEDEAAISLLIESVLTDQGISVVGPAYDVAAARALVAEQAIDCAVLDIRIGNDTIYDLASSLVDRSIPIVFVTACADIDERFRGLPTIRKPFAPESLEDVILNALLPTVAASAPDAPPAGRLMDSVDARLREMQQDIVQRIDVSDRLVRDSTDLLLKHRRALT